MKNRAAVLLSLMLLTAFAVAPMTATVDVRHLYSLSDFSGTIPYSDVLVFADRLHDEVYTTVGRTVRVFNASGMEIYRFGDDQSLGMIFGLAAEASGDLLLLTHDMAVDDPAQRWRIARCDYRGRFVEELEISGWPEQLDDFSPNQMLTQGGRLYLLDTRDAQLVVIDERGVFRRHQDLAEIIGLEDSQSQQIFGAAVDWDGNLVATVPVLFKVFFVAPDGTVEQFGTPGSAPGLFGIISGVAVDDQGNVLVSDKLRNVVMIFDSAFRFVREFGVGPGRETLVRPAALTLGNAGRLYVTQARRQGVSVFSIRTDEAAQASAEADGRVEQTRPVQIAIKDVGLEALRINVERV